MIYLLESKRKLTFKYSSVLSLAKELMGNNAPISSLIMYIEINEEYGYAYIVSDTLIIAIFIRLGAIYTFPTPIAIPTSTIVPPRRCVPNNP